MIVNKCALNPSSTIAHPRNGSFGITQRQIGDVEIAELRVKI